MLCYTKKVFFICDIVLYYTKKEKFTALSHTQNFDIKGMRFSTQMNPLHLRRTLAECLTI